MPPKKPAAVEFLWDAWCIASVIGIWPRFIEPKLLLTTELPCSIPNLPVELEGLRIVQLSDLHFQAKTPQAWLERIVTKVKSLKPDVLVFSGDFLCYSKLENSERLKHFLNQFSAPYGCYTVLGNHDYQNFVSVNDEGLYDVFVPSSSNLFRGFRRLAKTITVQGKTTEAAKQTGLHEELCKLLAQTPFRLLHNQTVQIDIGQAKLNICGVGEYMLQKCLPETAFKDYNSSFPGLILSHNPDSISILKHYPGDLILSGHTHGGQVNLPYMWKKFMLSENLQLKKGFYRFDGKNLYINRGLSGVMSFRWFSPPEVLLTILKKDAS